MALRQEKGRGQSTPEEGSPAQRHGEEQGPAGLEAGVPELSSCLAANATHQQQPLTLPAKVSNTGGGLTPRSPAGGTPSRSVLGNSPLSCEELLVAVGEVSVVRRTQGGETARARPESLVLSSEEAQDLTNIFAHRSSLKPRAFCLMNPFCR